MSTTVLVAGAGGFIGGHLCKRLREAGFSVRGADIKPHTQWWQNHCDWILDECDLRIRDKAEEAVDGVEAVYNLAADMGGMGFIETHKLDCMLSVLINTHLLMAAAENGVKRFFYSSSACAYPLFKQDTVDARPLREDDAYPAMPEDGYGWEKLFSERMCRHFNDETEMDIRVFRFHNCYGPNGAYKGGREKAPSAICRKVIEAQLTGKNSIDIWGDGEQTRTFMYVDDCVEGIQRLMASAEHGPLNLGSTESVTINQLVDLVEENAGVKLRRVYNMAAPKGVRGRSSDNTRLKAALNWEPSTPLRVGLAKTYAWVKEQMA